MPFKTIFYPAQGERSSPVDLLFSLCDENDQANITSKLKLLEETPRREWKGLKWLKDVQGMYQLRQGDFRVYVHIEKNYIIVTHICRKFGQTAKPKDLRKGQANFEKYIKER